MWTKRIRTFVTGNGLIFKHIFSFCWRLIVRQSRVRRLNVCSRIWKIRIWRDMQIISLGNIFYIIHINITFFCQKACYSLTGHQSITGLVMPYALIIQYIMHGGFIMVHIPAGRNPSGPVGRKPSWAQSSISFSSFSLFPSASAKDFPQRSPANYRLWVRSVIQSARHRYMWKITYVR